MAFIIQFLPPSYTALNDRFDFSDVPTGTAKIYQNQIGNIFFLSQVSVFLAVRCKLFQYDASKDLSFLYLTLGYIYLTSLLLVS